MSTQQPENPDPEVEDGQSDPSLDDGESTDWTGEGGATDDGPATDTDDGTPGRG